MRSTLHAASALAATGRLARWPVLALLVAALLLLGIASGHAWAKKPAVSAHPTLLSQVQFRDQRGADFRVEQLAGKTILLNFVFTSCAFVCPTQTRELSRVRAQLPDSLRDRVAFVSLSLDPERDTPLELARFAERNGASSAGWSFLATTPQATRTLVEQLQGAATGLTPNTVPVATSPAPLAAHNTALYLFDRFGRLLQRYVGAPIDQPRLMADLERADRVGAARSRSLFAP